MFKKINNYLDAATANIQVASSKMERRSEEMVDKAKENYLAEFGEPVITASDRREFTRKARQAHKARLAEAKKAEADSIPKHGLMVTTGAALIIAITVLLASNG